MGLTDWIIDDPHVLSLLFQDSDAVLAHNLSTSSSIGILSAETLAADFSNTDTFKFPNVSRLNEHENESGVFKKPILPPEKDKTGQYQGLPLSLVTPFLGHGDSLSKSNTGGFGETFNSVDQSNFSWAKVLATPEERSVLRLESDRPVSDPEFDQLNRTEHSFFSGQFSARSTSLGGSNDSRKVRTQDERFSDFSHHQATIPKRDEGSLSILSGPQDFMGMDQDIGDFSRETFQSQGGLEIIDAAEKEFKEDHEFSIGSGQEVLEEDLTKDKLFEETTPNVPDLLLNQSEFFRQHTSRLGSLDASITDSLRPNCGFENFVSPRKEFQDKTPKATSANTTYTVSSEEVTFTVRESLAKEDSKVLEEVEKLTGGIDSEELKSLIAAASDKHDPNLYSAVISNLKQVAAEKKTNEDVDATMSEFLPSFLEVTQISDQFNDKPTETEQRQPFQNQQSASSQDTSKITQLLTKKIIGQRFSSPIKERPVATKRVAEIPKKILFDVDKENKGTQVPTPELAPTQVKSKLARDSPNAFPIQANRHCLTWVGVAVGASTNETIVLQNFTNQPVVFKAIIRESLSAGGNGFSFTADNGSQRTMEIGSHSTITLDISFSPSDCQFCDGKLVLKLLSSGLVGKTGKSLKAVIKLQGQGGMPNFRLIGLGDFLNHRRVINFGQVRTSLLSWSCEIVNVGNSSGFFKLQCFKDADCRLKDDQLVSLNPSFGVLQPNTNIKISAGLNTDLLSCNEQGLFSVTLVLFYGSELSRIVMTKSRGLPGAQRLSSSPVLLGIDFTHPFSQNSADVPTFAGLVQPDDTAHFYNSTRKEVIDILGEKMPQTKFHTLPVEETLNESRINCTFYTNQFQPVSEEISHQPQEIPKVIEASKRSQSKKTVYLECENVMFPMTRVGQTCSEKVKIKNRTQETRRFRLNSIKKPFFAKHTHVNVSAQSYSTFPVFYQPVEIGTHRQTLIIEDEGGRGPNLTVQLVGNTSLMR